MANEIGLATYAGSVISKPSLWDLQQQVRASASAGVGNLGGFTIDALLDGYYNRNKGRKHMRVEENARCVIKKLLDAKQLPLASLDVVNLAQQLCSASIVEDVTLGDAKSYVGSQTKRAHARWRG